jgi:predicted DNA-binding transcriptional regulator AlpA
MSESNDLLDIDGLADLLKCSVRSIPRWADGGRLPRPIKLGRLNRWRRTDIESWIANGMPRAGKVRSAH